MYSSGLHGPDEPVYTISVAARLLGVSPQMLRQLEREGILEPARTGANARLYSQNELALLRHVCFLIRDRGINIAGVKAILEMEHRQNIAGGGVTTGGADLRERETVGSGAGKR
ncbi:MAG: MerR family transcriptional regulator [Ignavibacteriales bacterium]